MNLERFKNIVQYNIEHQSDVQEKVRDFREKVGITQVCRTTKTRLEWSLIFV